MATVVEPPVKSTPRSLWYDAYRRLKANKASIVSAVIIYILCIIALLANYVAPYSFSDQYMDKILVGPTPEHWLGTDSLGRDMLSRIIYGARMSMAVGILTAIISLVIGLVYGAISGWVGGRVDAMMMRFVDILYAIPTLVLMILVKVVFDSVNVFTNPELKALTSILLALSVVGWVQLARVVRGQVLQVKQMAYVEASRALGGSSVGIVFRHVLPNILGPIVVLLTFQIPANILYESFLSFIGLGLQPPYSSWGVLASEGYKLIRSYPHVIISPGVAIFVAMMAFQFFGDGLRDALDPKLRGKV
ncbi:MAG: ABC transporter permease [Bdellovibrionales bacterium]|nr:ABC transporter permease [Bdellovibrionales bacterium]